MISQHHHWGVHEHGIHRCLFDGVVTDRDFYDFASIEELLENFIGLEYVNQFLNQGGGFVLIDRADIASQTHHLTLNAYHMEPRWLTWITLAQQ